MKNNLKKKKKHLAHPVHQVRDKSTTNLFSGGRKEVRAFPEKKCFRRMQI